MSVRKIFAKYTFEKSYLIFLILAGVLLMLWGVDKPFVGLYNLNNNQLYWGASNYLQFGYLKLHLLPTYFEGQVLPTPIPYYLHHPILMYLIVSVLIRILGFSNWVIHLDPFIFSLGSLVLLYKVIENVWNQKIGTLTLISALLFPMFNFFWKMSVFEHVSLFFMMGIIYSLVLYLKSQKKLYLIIIFVLSLLAGLTDWGGAYLVAPLIVLLVINNKRKILVRPVSIYLVGIFISLSVFVIGVYSITHNLKELVDAILNRSVSSELFSLSLWPLKLFVITILRILLYFSPLALISPILFKKIKINFEQKIILFIFLVLGAENLVVLPSASWGHSFLMFYFVPFFALTSALLLNQLSKRYLYISLLLLLIFSFLINYLKNYQIEKQMWKYNAAVKFNKTFKLFEKIGTNNFPGEVFATYFNHETTQIPFNSIPDWIKGQKNFDVRFLVLPCTLVCSAGELDVMNLAQKYGHLWKYQEGSSIALLVERSDIRVEDVEKKQSLIKTHSNLPEKFSKIQGMYRFLRNFISAEQI